MGTTRDSPEAPAPDGSTGRARRILIVDDEAMLRELARTVLELEGFAVVEADGGRPGVAAVRAEPDGWGLVLLDLTMPDLGGREVLAEIRRVAPDVPVLLTSGWDHACDSEGLIAAGAVGMLPKPFKVSELLEAVNAALR